MGFASKIKKSSCAPCDFALRTPTVGRRFGLALGCSRAGTRPAVIAASAAGQQRRLFAGTALPRPGAAGQSDQVVREDGVDRHRDGVAVPGLPVGRDPSMRPLPGVQSPPLFVAHRSRGTDEESGTREFHCERHEQPLGSSLRHAHRARCNRTCVSIVGSMDHFLDHPLASLAAVLNFSALDIAAVLGLRLQIEADRGYPPAARCSLLLPSHSSCVRQLL